MERRNLTLLTDLYELTMMQGYFERGENETVVFDMFFRSNPNKGGYSIAAGLEQVIEYVKGLHFTYEDVDYLRKLSYENIDKAIIYGIDFTIRDLIDRGDTIHPDTMHCRNDLLIREAERSRHEN